MSTNDERQDVLAYRVRENAEKIQGLEEQVRILQADMNTLKTEYKYQRKDMEELNTGFNSLRKTLLTFAFTIAGAALVFSLSILAASGKIPG